MDWFLYDRDLRHDWFLYDTDLRHERVKLTQILKTQVKISDVRKALSNIYDGTKSQQNKEVTAKSR